MTNTVRLKGKMVEKSKTIATLSKEIGMSKTGLFNKIHNRSEFRISEVQMICAALSLTDTELKDIFFTDVVE